MKRIRGKMEGINGRISTEKLKRSRESF